ncbi:MAG: hypothetical protein ACRBI6_00020 [Acidimicrobiales bacterium]
MNEHTNGDPNETADDILDVAIDQTLAGAVPPPAADFWSRVDRDLAAVADERDPGRARSGPTGPVRAAPTAAAAQSGAAERDEDAETATSRDTDGTVVRLTDMDNTTTRSPLLLRAAAVAAVLALGVAGLAFALRGGDTTTEAATDGGDVTTTWHQGTTTAPPSPDETPVSTLVDESQVDEDAPVTTIPGGDSTAVSTAMVVVPGCGDVCELGPISSQDVEAAGVDPIGWCFWSADRIDNNGDGFDDPYVFAGEEAVFVADGTTIVLDGVAGTEENGSWIVTEYEHPDSDSGAIAEPYELEFEDLGPIVETSIESISQAATLKVKYDDPATDDDFEIEIRGTLSCGV